jgi:hypothetical protein
MRLDAGSDQAVGAADDVVLAEWPSWHSSVADAGEDSAIRSEFRSERRGIRTPVIRLSEAEVRRQRTAVRRFERETNAELIELLRAIDAALGHKRPRPLLASRRNSSQASLKTALGLLVSAGAMSQREADSEKRSLVHQSEIVARLAAVLQLYEAGKITIDELAVKRALLGPPRKSGNRDPRRATIDR